MSKNIMLNNERKRKKAFFIAIFHRYIPLFGDDKVLHFTAVEDERYNLIKENFYIDKSKVRNFLGNINCWDKVKFSARLIVDSSHPNGCCLKDVYFLRK